MVSVVAVVAVNKLSVVSVVSVVSVTNLSVVSVVSVNTLIPLLTIQTRTAVKGSNVRDNRGPVRDKRGPPYGIIGVPPYGIIGPPYGVIGPPVSPKGQGGTSVESWAMDLLLGKDRSGQGQACQGQAWMAVGLGLELHRRCKSLLFPTPYGIIGAPVRDNRGCTG